MHFGTLNGKDVTKVELSKGDISCSILDYGCTIHSLEVPDRDGNPVDVVLGYDTIDQYATLPGRMGATIGRFANRIAGGKLPISGTVHQLSINRPPHHIHGGNIGFDKRIWEISEERGDRAVFSLVSEDGDEGYPGRMETSVEYQLKTGDDTRVLSIGYSAISDKDTVWNPTNHSYFNLAREGTIDGHEVLLNTDKWLPVDKDGIPLGYLEDASELTGEPWELGVQDRYDTCFILNRGGAQAWCASKKTGIGMTVITDMPALQLYTGDGLRDTVGKGGKPIGKRSGMCFETEFPPDSPNNRYGKLCILEAGKRCTLHTTFKFISFGR